MTEEKTETTEEQSDLIKNDGKDLQRITSWIGRIEANTKKQNEMFSSLAEKLDAMSNKGPQFGDDEQDKFNAKLHEMILEGKVMEAMTLVNKVNREAETRIKQADKKKFETAIGAIADDPLMKNEDLSKQVRDTAAQFMNAGHDAQTAVELAKTKIENQALRSIAESGHGSLEMLAGGSNRPPATQEKKLPPLAEKAFQQGKVKGYFKDRQEYIDNLDPRVRAEWGL